MTFWQNIPIILIIFVSKCNFSVDMWILHLYPYYGIIGMPGGHQCFEIYSYFMFTKNGYSNEVYLNAYSTGYLYIDIWEKHNSYLFTLRDTSYLYVNQVGYKQYTLNTLLTLKDNYVLGLRLPNNPSVSCTFK